MSNEAIFGSSLPSRVRVNATIFAYFVLCRRKAWLFWHGIGMERHSELVELGKIISKYTYPREKHDVNIDNTVVLDWIDWHHKVVHEVKKSRRAEDAHICQVKYYLWYLEQKGLTGFTGIINYPKLRKIQRVELTDDDRDMIKRMLSEMEELFNLETPPEPERKPICKNCAYFELCWI